MTDGPEGALRRCEERLGQVEERLRLIEASVKDHAILHTDAQGVVTFWSEGAGRVFGYAGPEILGRSADILFTPEDREAGVPQRELGRAAEEGHGEDVRWHLRKDGTLAFLSGVVTPIRDGEGGLRGFAKVARDITERRRSEDGLREGEERHRAILESISDAFFALDRGWRFTYVNGQAERLVDRTQGDLLGKVFWDEFPGVAGTDFEGLHRRAMDEGIASSVEAFYPDHGRWYEVHAYPARDGLSIYFRDVTGRKRVEDELRVGGERLRLATEAMGLGIWDFNPQSGVVVMSDPGKAAFGMSPGTELTYEKFLASVPPGDRERVRRVNEDALGGVGGGSYEIEYQAVGLDDGIARWIAARGQAYFDREGRATRFLGTVLDVTGRKRAEERVRLEREWLSVTLASIGDAVIATDGERMVKFLNPVAEALTGWSQGEAAGRPLEEVFVIVNEATRRPVESPVDRVIREGVVVGLANHTVVIARDGRETAIEDSAAPIKGASGEVAGVVMIFQDATERRRAEAVLRESEGRHRAIPESITDAFFALDRAWRFTYVNLQAETLLGRTRDDLLGKDIWEEYAPAVGTEFDHAYRRAMDEGVSVTFEAYYTPHDRWYEVHAYPSGDGISVYFRDVGDRKRAERERERLVGEVDAERRHLQAVIESSPDCIKELDLEGRLVSVSENGRRLLEIGDLCEVLDKPWVNFWDGEGRGAATAAVAKALAGGVGAFEGYCPTAAGTPRWWDVVVTPILDGEGRPVRLLSVSRDVTERRRLQEERERLLAEAQDANRAKDDFLAVLSHELRTPLNPILLATSAMIDRPTPPEEFQPTLEMIRQNVNLQARLIDDLLDVTRIIRGKMPLHWGVSDCHDLIGRAVEICRSEALGKGHHLALDLTAEAHCVNADAARLQQVFWNLLKNAIKFTPEGGTIAIRTRNEGGSILVEVADTGIGIGPDILPQVFDAFHQGDARITRKFGGLGLGLAICRGVIEAHGGTIAAESGGRDRGTTFRVVLETVPEPGPKAENGAETSTLPPLNRLSILAVDDEATTLRLMARLLGGLGHQVMTAGTVAEAWEAFRRADGFDLIISDIGLPDGSGLDLMRKVKAVRPVPAIALTGYGMDEDIRRSREAGFTTHMTKPIDFSKLEAMIRQVAN